MKRVLVLSFCIAVSFIDMSFAVCPSGDLTDDCFVNLEDFSVLSEAWLCFCPDVFDPNTMDPNDIADPNIPCQLADIDNSWIVDANDLCFLAADWLSEGIPEPNIIWVFINDDGSGMKDEYGNPISHGGFVDYMSKYETTNAQYAQYLNEAKASGDIRVEGNYVKGNSGPYSGQNYYDLAGSGKTINGATNGGAARINWMGSTFTVDSGFDNHPVTYVSWYGSMAFASYYGWRLPTEWEWQAVADYDGSYIYGCGYSMNNSIANYWDSVHPDGTTVVGQFGTFGYGIADMVGNVWEWMDSCYYAECDPDDRVVRGGGWRHSAGPLSVRGHSDPDYLGGFMGGFRVCC